MPVVHELKANAFSLSRPDFATPKAREIPELIAWMLEAVWAAPEGSRTLHKEFTAQFKGRVASSGFVIGKHLAETHGDMFSGDNPGNEGRQSTSRVTPHLSPFTPHLSPFTPHLSPFTPHPLLDSTRSLISF